MGSIKGLYWGDNGAFGKPSQILRQERRNPIFTGGSAIVIQLLWGYEIGCRPYQN